MLTAEEHAAWFKRRGEAQLRELLHWRWDPIGLVPEHFPATWDEYDRYAPGVVSALRDSDGDAAAVEAELTRVETGHMGLSRRDAERTADAAREIAAWYRTAMRVWETRGELESARWRADGPRHPLRIVPLTDPEPPPLGDLAGDAAPAPAPAIAIDPATSTATVTWPRLATLHLAGVVATSLGPSRPLRAAPPGVVSEVLGSRWLRTLADIRRADLGAVRHLVLPLGDDRFFECACEHVALS